MTQRREEISPLLDKYKKDPNITDKDGKDPGSTRQIDENGQSRDMGANWAGIFPPRLRETGRSNILVAFHPRTLLGIPGSMWNGLREGVATARWFDLSWIIIFALA